eukprot:CAMPEP_0117418440 /NCGR_PEP_ID=MMETSP0758-20121206/217_1 /TAXON_ID=63605 /ORGANISM="Percolomonas cosmopolitus, Strain AE-1 (ATCC 50343)" /LENGTH=526 /DNA_ID=CAMNT_0005198937 /DNA_START=304 /DNA_END=1883 /DNA_ORIENTATION=-
METDESIERNKTHDKPFHYDEKVAHLKQEIEEALENERPKSLWQRVVFATRVLLRSLTLVIRSVPVIFYSTYLRLFPNSEYVKKSYYTYVLNTLRALGPVYIKLGQWMATRPDLFDEELTEVLGELHSFGTIHDHDESIQAIERCFGKPIDEIFESIDEQCIGSGAIAQVYRAKSKTFGDVAVKVRHPNLFKKHDLDLTILFPLLKLLVPKSLNLDANFSEFAESMLNQVDMRFEAYNNQHFLHTFRHSSEIVFAKPLSCSEEVIVSTFEEGDDVSTWLARPENTFSKAEHVRKLIASLGNAMYLKMVLVDNFMHGDLHPGNMKIRQNDEGHYEIVVLDTGIVYRLSNESKNDLVNIFISVSEKDGVALAHFLSKRGHPAREEFDRYVLNEKNGRFTSYSDQLNPVYRAYQEKMSKHLDTILSTPHAEIQAAYSFEKAIRIAREHGVEPETGFLHILLSTALIEGVARHINPQMEFVNDIKPTLRGIIKESDVLYRFVQRASSAKMKQQSPIVWPHPRLPPTTLFN